MLSFFFSSLGRSLAGDSKTQRFVLPFCFLYVKKNIFLEYTNMSNAELLFTVLYDFIIAIASSTGVAKR